MRASELYTLCSESSRVESNRIRCHQYFRFTLDAMLRTYMIGVIAIVILSTINQAE